MIDRDLSELIAPSKPRKAISAAAVTACILVIALAMVVGAPGSISPHLLFGIGPLVGLSGWAVNGRPNDLVGVACGLIAGLAVPASLYLGARGALIEVVGDDGVVPVWVGFADAWTLVTSWSPTWTPWAVLVLAPILGFLAGSGRLVR